MTRTDVMNFLVFADTEVGVQIVDFILDAGDGIEVLVLNSQADPTFIKDTLRRLPTKGIGRIIRSADLDQPKVVDDLLGVNADLGILAWWPYLIREPVLSLPRVGFLNFHPSLLPYNRGKHPNFWSLVEETPFGASIHWVDDKIDHGDVAFQVAIEKSWEDTGETLYHKAKREIVQLFIDNYSRIRKGMIPRIPQHQSLVTFHRASELHKASELFLDRKYKAQEILNLLRARTFPPHPACWFQDGSNCYEVRVQITRVGNNNDD